MPLTDKVSIETGKIHGNSWVANEDIAEGEVIWWIDDDYVPIYEKNITFEQMESWDEQTQKKFMGLAYQVDEGVLEGLLDVSVVPFDTLKEYYVNHCCDGNSWYDTDRRLIALRPIKKDEEINYDYALTESHKYFKLNCLCGTSKCRKTVSGDDWMIEELQQRYKGHFLSYLEEKIASLAR